jgi:hypothetical protein
MNLVRARPLTGRELRELQDFLVELQKTKCGKDTPS